MPKASLTERIEAVVALALAICATVAVVWHANFIDPPLVDDAGTSIAYAQTFFSGHGLRLTPYSQAVEGFSNPLWTFLLGFAFPLRLDPVRFARNLGMLLGLLGVLFTCAWGPAAERRLPRIEDAAPACVAAVTTLFPFWIAGGLETGLQVFLMALGGFLLCWQRSMTATTGLVFGLAALTHPEAALYALAPAGVVLIRLIRERRWIARSEWRTLAIFVGIIGAYEAFRVVWFASWLPNTYYAKAGWDFDRHAYFRNFSDAYHPLVRAAEVLLPIGFIGRGVTVRAWCSFVFVGIVVLFAWVAHGDWMVEWRFLAPGIVFLGAGMSAGISTVRSTRLGQSGWSWLMLFPATTSAMVWLSMTTARASEPRSKHLKEFPEYSVSYAKGIAQRLLNWSNKVGVKHPSIALPDLGGYSILLRNAEIIDDGGLADYTFARDKPSAAAIEDYLLTEGPPDIVNVHGPSGEVGGFHRLMAHYDHMEGFDSTYRGITYDADPRCPGGRPAVGALTPDALTGKLDEAISGNKPMEALALWRCARRYRDDDQLPSPRWQRVAIRESVRRADEAMVTQPTTALRYLSFATVLSNGDAWLRRRTETLRRSIFP